MESRLKCLGSSHRVQVPDSTHRHGIPPPGQPFHCLEDSALLSLRLGDLGHVTYPLCAA